MAWTAGDVTVVTAAGKTFNIQTTEDTAAFTPVAGRLYLVIAGCSAGNDFSDEFPDNVTHDGGLTFTNELAEDYSSASSFGGVALWWAVAPASGLSSSPVTLHFSSPPGTINWAVIEIQNQDVGIDTSDPIGSSDIWQGAGQTMGAFESADSMTLCFVGARGNTGAPEAGWTEIVDILETPGLDNSLCVAFIFDDDASIGYSHGQAAATKVTGGIEIKQSSGGAPIEEDVNQATTTETAQPVTRSKSKTLGLAVAIFTAQPTLGAKAAPVDQATTADTAGTLDPTKARPLGQSLETTTGQAIARTKAASVAQAVETATAQTLDPAKAAGLGQAVESATAGILDRAKAAAVGQAVDTETARPVSASAIVEAPVGQAVETAAAQPVAGAKAAQLGRATEDTTGATVGRAKARSIGEATAVETALALTHARAVTLGQSVSGSSAGLLARLKAKVLGPAVETDSALEVAASIAFDPVEVDGSFGPGTVDGSFEDADPGGGHVRVAVRGYYARATPGGQ